MSFEVYHGKGQSRSIPSGKVALSANGHARFSVTDVGAIGVDTRCTIEIDRDAESIAIRACKRGESPRAITAPSKGSRIITLGGALEVLGLTARKVAGWHDVQIHRDRLTIDFTEAVQ